MMGHPEKERSGDSSKLIPAHSSVAICNLIRADILDK